MIKQPTTLTNEVKEMIRQTVLPFKLEKTRDLITPHAGLSLLGEFAIGLGLLKSVDRYLPKPGSGAGYTPSEHLFPLILMLNGGGRSLEDLRQIRNDQGLRELLELDRMPSSDATGDWLRRSYDKGGLEGLGCSNRQFLKRGLKYDRINGYTLDIDATAIEAAKRSARWTYKMFKGYMPIVGHLAENGLIVGDEFRHGNEAPASRNLEFIKYCRKQLPKGKKITALRADSASYQAKIFNYCNARKNRMEFTIGAPQDEAVVREIKSLSDSVWRPYGDGHIAETVHSMNNTNQAFRLIVVRRPRQKSLFGGDSSGAKYTAIATNRKGKAEQVLQWYNQRGECSENRIKDLKIGFGMERMPCGQFGANAIFFRVGVLAYNIGKLFLLKALGRSWHRHQVRTVRWRLYQTAGKVVYHAGYVWLKVRREMERLFDRVRYRSWEFANG